MSRSNWTAVLVAVLMVWISIAFVMKSEAGAAGLIKGSVAIKLKQFITGGVRQFGNQPLNDLIVKMGGKGKVTEQLGDLTTEELETLARIARQAGNDELVNLSFEILAPRLGDEALVRVFEDMNNPSRGEDVGQRLRIGRRIKDERKLREGLRRWRCTREDTILLANISCKLAVYLRSATDETRWSPEASERLAESTKSPWDEIKTRLSHAASYQLNNARGETKRRWKIFRDYFLSGVRPSIAQVAEALNLDVHVILGELGSAVEKLADTRPMPFGDRLNFYTHTNSESEIGPRTLGVIDFDVDGFNPGVNELLLRKAERPDSFDREAFLDIQKCVDGLPKSLRRQARKWLREYYVSQEESNGIKRLSRPSRKYLQICLSAYR